MRWLRKGRHKSLLSQGEGARKENPRYRYADRRHILTRVARPRALRTGLCVCGTQPADISLSHRRRSPFLPNKGAPCSRTGPQRTGLTPAVPYHLYNALIVPQLVRDTGLEQSLGYEGMFTSPGVGNIMNQSAALDEL